jgi:hypothetical protein
MTKRAERKKRKSDEIEEINADDVSEDATAAHVKALLAYTERRVRVRAFGEEGACVYVHPGASSLSDDEIVTRATKVATMVQTPIVEKRYRYDMGIRVVFASLFTRPPSVRFFSRRGSQCLPARLSRSHARRRRVRSRGL